MTTAPRVLFFADAGPEVGGGHVMRCLTLARALVERGADCAFLESRAAAPILRRFGWPEHALVAMVEAETLEALVASGREFADRFEADAVVIDHYGVGAAEETTLRGLHRRIVVIDDLANRLHACDLLIDPGYGRRRADYSRLVRAGCVTLVGPGHALIRPEFAQARPRALSRRARHDPVRRVQVSLGLTDVGGITGEVVAALTPHLGDVRLEVVVGADAPSYEALAASAEAEGRIRLHPDADMPALTAECDLAVGAGGSSTWERACLGLPSITLILADNQVETAERLETSRATLAVDARAPGFEPGLIDAWRQLTQDASLRWTLSQRASELCDGRGADRVADAAIDLLTPR
ncbi:MAG TPA: UDP-2,4-diacetamido-2,4,6-trideoxy-beta-L-altropyranose hydrolase [Caulobacteraceae bacterium]|nr:UDP-2,4-diacetamido-2,4,6-trideoxy-beta-L-altropyranose hydrolase [Caulobacteraceae bacterium]